jgi:uncharacterized membrane protein
MEAISLKGAKIFGILGILLFILLSFVPKYGLIINIIGLILFAYSCKILSRALNNEELFENGLVIVILQIFAAILFIIVEFFLKNNIYSFFIILFIIGLYNGIFKLFRKIFEDISQSFHNRLFKIASKTTLWSYRLFQIFLGIGIVFFFIQVPLLEKVKLSPEIIELIHWIIIGLIIISIITIAIGLIFAIVGFFTLPNTLSKNGIDNKAQM